jgi:hypothetical protein
LGSIYSEKEREMKLPLIYTALYNCIYLNITFFLNFI